MRQQSHSLRSDQQGGGSTPKKKQSIWFCERKMSPRGKRSPFFNSWLVSMKLNCEQEDCQGAENIESSSLLLDMCPAIFLCRSG